MQVLIKSYAKINLALNIVGKNSLLHKIESVIAFINLHDKIIIRSIESDKHNISFFGKFSKKIGKDNTVSKLFKILEKKNFLKNKKFKIKIKKNIPTKAGLGGGSMNAAHILSYLMRKKIVKINKKELKQISKSVGSDMILGFYKTNCILNSREEIKVFRNSKKIYTLIVKPSFGCSTKKIYSKVKKFDKPRLNKINKEVFSLNNLKKMGNSLEPIVFSNHNKLKNVKIFLENLLGVAFVRMTGSGSALVAYFQSKKRCHNAQKQFRKKYKNYWCMSSKTI